MLVETYLMASGKRMFLKGLVRPLAKTYERMRM